jgi:beta-glucosidase
MLRISGRSRDLRRDAADGATLRFRYRVTQPPDRPVELGMRCGEQPCGIRSGVGLDITRSFSAVPVGAWQELRVPLSCFVAAGMDLGAVEVPFTLVTAGHFGLTVSEVSLQPRARGAVASCP